MRTILQSFATAGFLLASTFISPAQEVTIVGGMNVSSQLERDDDEVYSDESEVKSRIGGHLGALVNIGISGGLSLETGLMLSTKGDKFVEEEDGDKFIFNYNISYLDLPFTAKYNFSPNDNFQVFGLVGPVLGIALRGVAKDVLVVDGEREFEGYNLLIGNDPSDDDIKRLDFGMMFGAGVQYDRFRLGLFYNLGLMNISPFDENGYRMKNRAMGISLGYILNKK